MNTFSIEDILRYRLNQNKGKIATKFEDIEDGSVITSSDINKFKKEIVFLDLKEQLLIVCYYNGTIMDQFKLCADITEQTKPHIVDWYNNKYNNNTLMEK